MAATKTNKKKPKNFYIPVEYTATISKSLVAEIVKQLFKGSASKWCGYIGMVSEDRPTEIPENFLNGTPLLVYPQSDDEWLGCVVTVSDMLRGIKYWFEARREESIVCTEQSWQQRLIASSQEILQFALFGCIKYPECEKVGKLRLKVKEAGANV